MSPDFAEQVGITDPTLQWVNQAEALLRAPGIDPVAVLMRSDREVIDCAGVGYLVTSTVHLGDGQASTEIYAFGRDQAQLSDLKTPDTMYGTGYATVRFKDAAPSATIMHGNLSDHFSDYDSPGFSGFTSGRARVVAVGDTGNFVAVQPPVANQGTKVLHAKSRNPLSLPDLERYEQPVQLSRMVRTTEDVIQVTQAIAEGAGMNDVSRDLYRTVVQEQLYAFSALELQRSAGARKAAEQSRFGAAVGRVLSRKFGLSLSDDRP